jgi:hypothetical protein
VYKRILQPLFRVSPLPVKLACWVCTCSQTYMRNRCYTDCRISPATTTDTAMRSRDSRLVELSCESYSIMIESLSEFYNSLSLASESLSATDTSSPNATTTTRTASQGAGAGQITPQATTWVDRPSSTVHTHQSAGVSSRRGMGFNAVTSITAVLAISSILCRL